MLTLFALLLSASPPCRPAPPPPGLVSLVDHVPTIRLDVVYATPRNVTGAPLPGYAAAAAWVRKPVADALARVQQDLAPSGLGLLIHDAYRPRRATLALVAWARRAHPGKRVIGPYVATRSRHNLGIAVDLTLADLRTGKPLDMGSAYDAFGPISHTHGVKGPALQRRLQLRRAMERRGFQSYSLEWWHFHIAVPGASALDIPYACSPAPPP